jgi:hypothetical protein
MKGKNDWSYTSTPHHMPAWCGHYIPVNSDMFQKNILKLIFFFKLDYADGDHITT